MQNRARGLLLMIALDPLIRLHSLLIIRPCVRALCAFGTETMVEDRVFSWYVFGAVVSIISPTMLCVWNLCCQPVSRLEALHARTNMISLQQYRAL